MLLLLRNFCRCYKKSIFLWKKFFLCAFKPPTAVIWLNTVENIRNLDDISRKEAEGELLLIVFLKSNHFSPEILSIKKFCLFQLKTIENDNLNKFYGICFNQQNELFILWTFVPRGTLEVFIFKVFSHRCILTLVRTNSSICSLMLHKIYRLHADNNYLFRTFFSTPIWNWEGIFKFLSQKML